LPKQLLQQIGQGAEGNVSVTISDEDQIYDASVLPAVDARKQVRALQQDLPALVDTVSRLHRQKSIFFRQDLNHIKQLPIEQQDGMELLGNLLDNAWKWARSTVYLNIKDSMPMLITIEDDGPGVEAAELNSLTQRGVRHDESRPGHGIGLSIVSSLVAELGGTTEITRSVTLGGLKRKNL